MPVVGFFVLAVFLGFAGILYGIYRKRNPPVKMSNDMSLPRYARIIPTKQGDYYSIIGGWAQDDTSRDMVIHNINPLADEAKMTIQKTTDGYVMLLHDRDGNLLLENKKITQFELAAKFMELRTPPAEPGTSSESQPPANESNTLEIK